MPGKIFIFNALNKKYPSLDICSTKVQKKWLSLLLLKKSSVQNKVFIVKQTPDKAQPKRENKAAIWYTPSPAGIIAR